MEWAVLVPLGAFLFSWTVNAEEKGAQTLSRDLCDHAGDHVCIYLGVDTGGRSLEGSPYAACADSIIDDITTTRMHRTVQCIEP